jgi:adenosylcobinamide-GDP ribazoletransferase
MKDWLDDLRAGVAFLTRIPMPLAGAPTPEGFARAQRVFPMIGAVIGAAVGLVYLALATIGVPAFAAAALALGAGAFLTGALHEDGLADVADGFGGGRDRARKLEIMRDSRVGTYGVLILLVSFAAKLAALAALPPRAVLPTLLAVHALARAPMTVMAATMPYARSDGLAATAGRPDRTTAATSVILALVIAFLALPWLEALAAGLVVAIGALGVATLAQRQIGGQTGDVLGAAEQVGETLALVLLAARLAHASA